MKKTYLKTFFARCLTLLVLALLSTNLAWGADYTNKEISFKSSTLETGWTTNGTFNSSYFKMTTGQYAQGTSTALFGTDVLSTDMTINIACGTFGTWSGNKNVKVKAIFYDSKNIELTSVEKTYTGLNSTQGTYRGEMTLSKPSNPSEIAYLKIIFSDFTTGNDLRFAGVKLTYSTQTAGPTKTLSSIAVSSKPTKTTYEAGETFDPAGLKVMGTYEGQTAPEEITSGITWTFDPDPLTAGTTSVSVTAKVGEITSPEYTVNDLTVNARTPYTFGFETDTSLDWDFTNMASKQTHSDVNAYTDSYFGTTGGKETASMTTKNKVAKPGVLKCYVSKTTTNTTASSWKIQVSSDINNWTDVKEQSATSMTKGEWVEFAVDLSSYEDVYVRIYYSGSSAVRCIDNVSLSLAKDIEYIAVKTAPTKTTYNVGETFDPAGLVITATYKDEPTADIAYAGNESKFTFNPSLTTALTKANDKVTITYGEKSVGQAITVNLIKLAKPTNLQATPTSTSATLTWDAVEHASSYEVYVSDMGSYEKTLPTYTNSLSLNDLTASTQYLWSVKAIGDNVTYSDGDANEDGDFTTTALPTVAYTVYFDGNNHGTPASASITEASAGAGVTLPDCTPNEGYQFVGWATTNTATEADAGVAGATYYPTENITLYAVYNKVFTITWSVNGTPTTEVNPTTSVVEGEGITTLPTAPASISGMAFQGWTATQIATSSATAPTDLFTDAEHAPAITANTTFYAVFAEESEGDVTWDVIQNANDLQASDVIIISTNKDYTSNSMKTAGTISSSLMSCLASTYNSDKTQITSVADGTLEFTLGGNSTSGWTLQNGTNYLGMSGDKKVALSSTSSTWSISISSGVATVSQTYSSKSYSLQYNYNSGNDRFTGYTSGQTAISLYKKTQEITYTYYTNIVVKELTSISLSGEYPKEFWKGDTFNHDGITVTAHYSNAPDADVTDKAEFTGYNMATAGEQEVTVTYDTKEAKYNITVKSIVNTKETAYTVTEAKAIIDANPSELATTNVYVKGTVSKIVTAWDSQYGNITFDVSADGQTTDDQFQFYRNFKDAENTQWASAAECPAVGDDVIGIGTMKKHGSTYEFDSGNYLVSHVKASTIEIKDITVEINGDITPVIETNVVGDYTMSYTSNNENVVLADGDEMVTMGLGTATITATLTAEGYKNATTTFTVEVIKALSSIEVKTAPTAVSYKVGDKFDPAGLVITAKYNDESTEDVAYAGNEDKFTFDPSLETALTTENTSVTITYAGKEATQAISVRALYTYDITWMANGVEHAKTQVTEGDALALPGTSPAKVGDMVFQGWINTDNYYDAETAPEYIVPSEIIPTDAMTFYAVFAKATEELEEKDVTYTFTSKAWADATSSWTSGKDGNEYTKNQGVQVTYGVTGANATSKSEFTEVTKVVVNYCTNAKAGKGTISVKVGDGTPQTYSVSAPSSEGQTLRNTDDMIFDSETGKVNITVDCETNSIYINSITITSKVGEETISNYCTRFANVEISSAGWATVCLPFKATITSGNAIAYYVTDTKDNALTKDEADVIPAEEGILLKGKEGEKTTVTFTISDKDADPATGNMMKGAITETTFDESGYKYYILANGKNGLGFYYQGAGNTTGASVTCAAGKAILAVPTTSGAKAFFSLDNEPTGITSYENDNDNENLKAMTVYNLNGMKVNPSTGSGQAYKGIVIMNGKKYINK